MDERLSPAEDHVTDPLQFDFVGKQILVIGGSTGIGNAAAQLFKRCGGSVLVTGTRDGAGSYGADDFSDLEGLGYHRLDLTSRAALKDWTPDFTRLDVLVLCHALTYFEGEEYDSDIFRKVVDVNLNSVFDCAERFKPMLATTKGSIVVVSSLAAYRTIPAQPAYTASKSALLGLIRALSMSYIADGIRVNGIAPGLARTKMGRIGHPKYEELVQKTVRRIPMRRTGETEEMAGPILFLCSPFASYMIGQTLIVDGGMSLTS
jgi:3-oxoacyl-[acyl-carrier protein] reductase